MGRVYAENICIVARRQWQLIYPLLVGSGILYCWSVVVGMAGCDNGPLLGPCGHSKLHLAPQACCVEKGFPYGAGVSGGRLAPSGDVRVSLIEKKLR